MLAFELSTETKISIPQSVESRQAQKPRFVELMQTSTFGQRLKLAFNNAKNAEIAEKIGVGVTAVTNYMAGRVPDAEKLVKIRESTKCDLNWLLTGEETTTRAKAPYNQTMVRRLTMIAREQAPAVYGDADIGGENAEVKTFELLLNYLLARSLKNLNLIDSESDVLSLVEIMRAKRFTFLANIPQSFDDRIGEIIEKKIGGNSVSSLAQDEGFRAMISELVQEEVAKATASRKRPLINIDFGHGDEEDVPIPRRKAG